MQTRKLGPFDVSALGLGCMSMSHGYGTPDEAEAIQTLNKSLDLGYTMLDTAALYGFGKNETLLGKALKSRRDEYVLASKCGIFCNEDGKRVIDGRPEVIRKTCEDALKRLQTDVIDLYYLHRYDKKIPIEESVGALSDLVSQGKIKTIGLSECSADTLRKAHKVHPITALQTEYSLWTRNPEITVLDACRELGVTFVAFSPLARGFLTGKIHSSDQFEAGDLRNNMPRFQGDNLQQNLKLLGRYEEIAQENNCTMSQLALAWVLAQGNDIVPIPGTWHVKYAEENAAAADIKLSPEVLAELDQLINQKTVVGGRYAPATQAEIDTEEF